MVAHAATPAQLCVTAAGLEYYFIGPDGVEAGPLLPTMIELGETYPAFPAVADTPYSVDKPYIFTLNESYEVTYQAW